MIKKTDEIKKAVSERLKNDMPLKAEIKRKMLHLSSMSMPIGMSLVSRQVAIWGLAIGAALVILAEVLRIENRNVRHLVYRFFRDMFRHKEMHFFTGSAYIVFSGLILALVFPLEIATISMIYIVMGDFAAAIFGRAFGRIRLLGNSTLVGTLAFIVFAAGFSVAFFWVPYEVVPIYNRIFGAVFAAMVELLVYKVDDNLAVPILSALMLSFSLNI